MAQVQAAAQKQDTALQVYGEDHPALTPLLSREIVSQVEHCLEGSDLTFRHLLIDMGAYLAANPSIQQYVTTAGLYNCMLTAARHHTTFGDGGMWILPEKNQLRPQESEKYITSRAGEAGWDIRVVLIHAPHKPVTVMRGDAGEITSFGMSEADITVVSDEGNMVGAFGVATNQETSQRRIEWFDRTDLERRKNHSAAVKAGRGTPMWDLDPLKGYERSVRAAMGRLLVPIRTRSPGKVGSMVAPFAGEAIDVKYEPVALEAGDSGAEIANALGSGDPPDGHQASAFEAAAKVLEDAADVGGLGGLAAAWREHVVEWRETLSAEDFMAVRTIKDVLKDKLMNARKSDSEPGETQGSTDPPAASGEGQEPPESPPESVFIETLQPQIDDLPADLKKAMEKPGSSLKRVFDELSEAWAGIAASGERPERPDRLKEIYASRKDAWGDQCESNADLKRFTTVVTLFRAAAKQAGVPGPW